MIFLGRDPEVATIIIHALRGADTWKKEESISLRHASVLISKGYFCHPRDVALIIEMHLKAVSSGYVENQYLPCFFVPLNFSLLHRHER